jgi:hypothetical protein
MTDENDMALAALLKAGELEPSLPTELLRKSYAIQRRHQFDRDDPREVSKVSKQELLALLEATLDAGMAP